MRKSARTSVSDPISRDKHYPVQRRSRRLIYLHFRSQTQILASRNIFQFNVTLELLGLVRDMFNTWANNSMFRLWIGPLPFYVLGSAESAEVN